MFAANNEAKDIYDPKSFRTQRKIKAWNMLFIRHDVVMGGPKKCRIACGSCSRINLEFNETSGSIIL